MSQSDRGNDNARHLKLIGGAGELAMDASMVLVVGKSSINRVVVSKIVERSGLRPISQPPETAGRNLRNPVPCTVVLDGGPHNSDCDELLPEIATLRRLLGRPLPAVVLLSNNIGTPESLGISSIVDAVVAKPITTERLQPVVDDLISRRRG